MSSRPEPKTVPPPRGAKDAYSAPTRVGTLPEEVLAAMRQQETDASLAARTQSGTRAATRPSPPPLPADVFAPARTSVAPPSATWPPASQAVTTLPPPPPFGAPPLFELGTPPPFEPGAPPLPSMSTPPPFGLSPPASFDLSVDVEFPPQPRLARSIVIVVCFAVLGGLLAAAILFW
ncbi:MAG: hypothetical protein KF764_24430 [Labilithrix sp.]|nr:hypothetical protein [Labilithrix sp.]